jgi:hypothetical protein
MASVDGFTRYDVLGVRFPGGPAAEAAKHHQRAKSLSGAVRSAIRSEILTRDAKSHPIIVAGVPNSALRRKQVRDESARRTALADGDAVAVAHDLLAPTGGATGGYDPRVRHNKIKSEEQIAKEVEAALARVDKARSGIIEIADPLRSVKITLPAKPGLGATQTELDAFDTALKHATELAEMKKQSAQEHKSRSNRLEQVDAATRKGLVGLVRLQLEQSHPSLTESDYKSELAQLSELRDEVVKESSARKKAERRALYEAAEDARLAEAQARQEQEDAQRSLQREHRLNLDLFGPYTDVVEVNRDVLVSLSYPELERLADEVARDVTKLSTELKIQRKDKQASRATKSALDYRTGQLSVLKRRIDQLNADQGEGAGGAMARKAGKKLSKPVKLTATDVLAHLKKHSSAMKKHPAQKRK